MPTGIAVGFDSKAAEVRKHLAKSMLGLTSNLQASMSAPTADAGKQMAGGQMATAGAQISIGDIIVNVAGTNATPKQIGAAVQDGLLKSMRAVGAA
jgi:hypothetical protein